MMGKYGVSRKRDMISQVVSEMEVGEEFTSRQIVEILTERETKHYIPSTHFVGHILSRMDNVKKRGRHNTIWVRI